MESNGFLACHIDQKPQIKRGFPVLILEHRNEGDFSDHIHGELE
jgi:hypothetical protein